MNILNVEERKELQAGHYNSPAQFFDAIEAAVIKRLAAGVGVEPYATLHHDDGYFTTKQREHDLRYSGPMRTEVVTLDQLNTAIAAARVQVYDECMKLCDPDALGLEQGDDCATGVYRVEKAIRALKGGAA